MTFLFSFILSALQVFVMGYVFLCIAQRISICAGVFPFAVAISAKTDFFINTSESVAMLSSMYDAAAKVEKAVTFIPDS